MSRVARFAWVVLAYNVSVINWGAYVRATGSGAGCGAHWPLCNGDVIPRAAGVATLIEFSHRLTSGLALLAVLTLLVWTFRARPPGHPARTGAALSAVFIATEAAVGAGLVLFELVADNATMARAMFMMVHLLNTFLLLGCLTLTAWWLTDSTKLDVRARRQNVAAVIVGCAMLLLAGASGSVAALGDTLFPSTSFRDALWADLSAGSHLLIRLRVLHPVIAIAAAVMVMAVSVRLSRGSTVFARRTARVLVTAAIVQLGLGFLNVALFAPVWLQLLHLATADIIWIGFVLLGASALSEQVAVVVAESFRLKAEATR